jgi:hypothetical protein
MVASMRRTPRRPRPGWALLACAASFATVLGGACTTFNGLGLPPVPATDGGDAAVGDAAPGPGYTAYLSLQDAARVCTLVFQCAGLSESITESLALQFSGGTEPSSFPLCMDLLAGPVDPGRPGLAIQRAMLSQLAAATTCAAAAAIPYVRQMLDAGCPHAESCADGFATRCSAGAVFQTSCDSPLFADGGATCVLAAAPDGGTGNVAACDSPTPCGNTRLFCAGDTVHGCDTATGTLYTYDCSVSGRVCGIGPANLPRCQDDCLTTTQAWDCKDNAVRVCRPMVQSELACAPIGASCKTSAAGTPYCARTGAPCTPFDGKVGTCSGNSIALCINGQPASFDCGAIGQACQSANADQSAHCGP